MCVLMVAYADSSIRGARTKDRTAWCPTADASEVNNLYRAAFQVLPSSSLSLPSFSLSLFLSCVCGEIPFLSTRSSTIVLSMQSSTHLLMNMRAVV
jgi:hypothetical protein